MNATFGFIACSISNNSLLNRYWGEYYDPDIQRFTREDTHWNVGNMIYGDKEYQPGQVKMPDASAIGQSNSLYSFCLNNPILHTDVTGNSVTVACIIIGAIVGAVVGGYVAAKVSYDRTGEVKPGYVAIGILGGGTLGGLLGWGLGALIAALPAGGAAEVSTTGMSSPALYRTLDQGVNFAKAALEHLSESARAVPLQVLIEAIKSGSQMADPQGSSATMFVIQMVKNGKQYTLEVLYDVVSNTIYHFKYY